MAQSQHWARPNANASPLPLVKEARGACGFRKIPPSCFPLVTSLSHLPKHKPETTLLGRVCLKGLPDCTASLFQRYACFKRAFYKVAATVLSKTYPFERDKFMALISTDGMASFSSCYTLLRSNICCIKHQDSIPSHMLWVYVALA